MSEKKVRNLDPKWTKHIDRNDIKAIEAYEQGVRDDPHIIKLGEMIDKMIVSTYEQEEVITLGKKTEISTNLTYGELMAGVVAIRAGYRQIKNLLPKD